MKESATDLYNVVLQNVIACILKFDSSKYLRGESPLAP